MSRDRSAGTLAAFCLGRPFGYGARTVTAGARLGAGGSSLLRHLTFVRDKSAPAGNDAGLVTTLPDSGSDADVDATAPVDASNDVAADASVDAGHPPLVDSDGDGFLDGDDPAPNDPTIPGDFSTPASILNDPRVKAALAGAKAAGSISRRTPSSRRRT